MGIPTFDEATRPGGTGYVITFYKLDCPKCHTVTVGMTGDDYWRRHWDGNYNALKCRCGCWATPETRKVDLAT